MSVVELLKTIDGLANAINEKNKEIENLKRNYSEKIFIVNSYISLLQQAGSFETDKQQNAFNEEDLIKALKEPLRCSKCSATIISNESNKDFFILPKNTIQFLNGKIEEQVSPPKLETNKSNETTIQRSEDKYSKRNDHKNKSKKTCSYCHKTGHSKARCFKRLNTTKSS